MTTIEYRLLPIESLRPGKYQTRQTFDEQELALLAETIALHGLIQPIVVRQGIDHYEIVAGERRFRAAQRAKLFEVPCLIRPYSDEQAAAITTIENTSRVNLNPIEEARAYQQLIDGFGYVHEEIAAVVGKSRAKITNSLRLLKLEERVQQMLIDQALSEGHGKVLASLSPAQQYFFASEALRYQWSIRQLEQRIKRDQKAPRTGIRHSVDPDIASLERLVSEKLGTEATLESELDPHSGWLKIKYYDLETLSGILERLNIQC
jgi:ParB family chromosome partitioning protein